MTERVDLEDCTESVLKNGTGAYSLEDVKRPQSIMCVSVGSPQDTPLTSRPCR